MGGTTLLHRLYIYTADSRYKEKAGKQVIYSFWMILVNCEQVEIEHG